MDLSNRVQLVKKQNLISDFAKHLGPPITDEIPEGFFNAEQIAKEYGLGESRMAHRLAELSKANKVERRQFRNQNGRVCWFYRVK